MKKYGYILLALVTIASCATRNELPAELIGGWQRDFYPAPGKRHVVEYAFYKDSVHYHLAGDLVNAQYTLLKDAFIPNGNRFVGHDGNGDFYVIFVETAPDSILLYKEKVSSIEDGLKYKKPGMEFKGNHSQGWNSYKKQPAQP